jgi:hypothetical protein
MVKLKRFELLGTVHLMANVSLLYLPLLFVLLLVAAFSRFPVKAPLWAVHENSLLFKEQGGNRVLPLPVLSIPSFLGKSFGDVGRFVKLAKREDVFPDGRSPTTTFEHLGIFPGIEGPSSRV